MRILILYNVAETLRKGTATDLICEQEITIIVPLVVDLLSARGHHVETLRTGYDLWERLKERRGQFDIVLNLAEAFGGTNTNEPVVPAMLEALEIPFTGASARNMHLTLDKEMTQVVAFSQGVRGPSHQVFRSRSEKLRDGLDFPLIVKPIREEASIGIQLDSVVMSRSELYRKVAETLRLYKQPALVEDFIEGREISVGVIGSGRNLTVFPPLEFLFPDAESELQQIRSYDYKWGGRKEVMVRADLPEDVVRQLAAYTRTMYLATECRDYARMDYRLTDEDDIPYLLEVNYNPGIGPNTHGLNNTLTMMASFVGMTFEDLVEQVVLIAAKRYGIRSRKRR